MANDLISAIKWWSPLTAEQKGAMIEKHLPITKGYNATSKDILKMWRLEGSPKIKKHKYSAQKTNGYDSKKEAKRAEVLKVMEQAGEITNLREQVPYVLCPAQYVKGFNGKEICARREMKYIADFVYIQDGKEVVNDAKGFRTKEYKKKANLMKKVFGITILET